MNGDLHEVGIPSHYTLLETLRYRLGLTGSKQGCDKGDCGACTVIVDGAPTLACITPAWEAEGRDVVTVEGADVVSSGLVEDRWLDKIRLQKHRPERLMVPGVGGYAARRLFFVVEGAGEITVRYDNLKAGAMETSVRLGS